MELGHKIASKDGKLAVSITTSLSSTLLRLLFDETEDDDSTSWQNWLSQSLYSISLDGTHLAVAYGSRYMLLEYSKGQECRLVSVGESSELGESITSIACLGVFLPKPRSFLCIAVGYSTGFLRIYSVYGHILTMHQLHSRSLIGIRHRIPLTDEDVEELSLTYADGTVVNVDGTSLYLALRLCLSEDSNSGSRMISDGTESSLQYQKWTFEMERPGLVSDAVSFGANSQSTGSPPLAMVDGRVNPNTSTLGIPPLATARFLVAPQQGSAALGVFMSTQDATTSYSSSAVGMAGKMAAKVTGAVLNMAKSYLWGGGGSTTIVDESNQQDTSTDIAAEPGTMVSCVMVVRDSPPPRKVNHIVLAPASFGLAAMTDNLGRTMVFDLENLEMLYMIKGLRGSQCGWIEPKPSILCVVIYASKQGTLDIYQIGQPDAPLTSVHIGAGWKLVQYPVQPLGGSLPVGTSNSKMRRAVSPQRAQCLLVSNRGYIGQIEI